MRQMRVHLVETAAQKAAKAAGGSIQNISVGRLADTETVRLTYTATLTQDIEAFDAALFAELKQNSLYGRASHEDETVGGARITHGTVTIEPSQPVWVALSIVIGVIDFLGLLSNLYCLVPLVWAHGLRVFTSNALVCDLVACVLPYPSFMPAGCSPGPGPGAPHY